jgi:hypothetical protein
VSDDTKFRHGGKTFTYEHYSPVRSHTLIQCSYLSIINSYIGYAKDQVDEGMSSKEETLMAFFALVQSILLGSFAAILAAHRSEILDKPGTAVMDMMDEMHGIGGPGNAGYVAPEQE